MQDPDHQKSRCPKCHADQGEPCRTLQGAIADKVHYGRPYWSGKTKEPPAMLRGRGVELDINLIEFSVIKDLLDRDPKRLTNELFDLVGRPTLFAGTAICADCGERYSDPPLIRRCEKRHDQTKRPIR